MPKLSRTERLILANQYLILEMMDPPNAATHVRARQAVESGYVVAMNELFQSIADGLGKSGCKLVRDTLSMYEALQQSFDRLDDKTGIEASAVDFPGFDSGEEAEHMGYARFAMEDQGHFGQLRMPGGLDSHTPSLDGYRAMLKAWKGELEGSRELSAEQIRQVLEANKPA